MHPAHIPKRKSNGFRFLLPRLGSGRPAPNRPLDAWQSKSKDGSLHKPTSILEINRPHCIYPPRVSVQALSCESAWGRLNHIPGSSGAWHGVCVFWCLSWAGVLPREGVIERRELGARQRASKLTANWQAGFFSHKAISSTAKDPGRAF